MKSKIILPAILLLTAVLLYSFINPQISQNLMHSTALTNNNISDKFLFGAIMSQRDISNSFHNVADSLHFNINHEYVGTDPHSGRHYPIGLTDTDRVVNPISSYVKGVNQILNDAYAKNMRTILCRPKIEWLVFGQRSDYQFESEHLNSDLWFYTFQEHRVGKDIIDNSSWGSDTTKVCYCQVGDGADIVAWKLKANTEQCNTNTGPEVWRGDSECKWLVKLRIRADTAFINNKIHKNDTVCSIKIYNNLGFKSSYPDSNIHAKFGLLAKNFYKDTSNLNRYTGEYMEEFYLHDDTLRAFSFDGDLGGNAFYSARCNKPETDTTINHSDIHVKWYNSCNVWFDYIRLDNDVADELFNHKWDTAINEEVTQIANNGSGPNGFKFYVELTQFNNIPCMEYINKLLQQYSTGNNIDLMTDLTWDYAEHVNWDNKESLLNAGHIYRNFIKQVGFKQIFTESYPLTANFVPKIDTLYSKIPNSLSYNNLTQFLQLIPVSPDSYDTWLQYNLDERPFLMEGGQWTDGEGEFPQLPGYNRFWLNICRQISDTANIPFIHMPQGHLWYNPHSEVRREPTNEELEMLSNIALTFGVKGLIYFCYPSIGTYGDTVGGKQFGLGIANTSGILRDTNEYGETGKWKVNRDIGLRAKKWEPYLLSFNNQGTSYFYQKDKTAMSSETFINDFITKDTSLHQDSTLQRYVQGAVFNNDSTDTRYFMVVNRRCSPISAGNTNGGRNIQVKFNANSGSFIHFNNWKIIDLETDTTVVTFDKTVSSYLDLGWFNPGQGKLYKVVPVMKTGGTFVGNESIKDISFECNGTVYNNGYNLTLEKGVNISFDNRGQIVMKKGTFISGVSDALPVTYCNFKGQQNKKWYGLVFDSTYVNMNYTNISDVKPYEIKDTANHFDSLNYGYAFYSLNSNYVRVSNCNFNSDTTACIKILYASGAVSSPTILIKHDSLKVNTNIYRPIDIFSNSTVSGTFQIENNDIRNNLSGGGGLGIFIYGISHAVFYGNLIRNFQKGIYSMHSSIDLWANIITNGTFGGNGTNLHGESYTIFDLSSTVGGFNTLNMYTGECINLDASYFDIRNGGNSINIYDSLGYNLHGYFPEDTSSTLQDGRGNCFGVHGADVDSAHTRINVVLSDGTTHVNYRLLPFADGCNPADNSRTKSDEPLTFSKSKSKNLREQTAEIKKGLETKSENNELHSYALYSEMKTALKENDYSLAADKCRKILELGEEDMYSVDAVRKLFHCIALSKNGTYDNTPVKVAPVTKTNQPLTDANVRIGKPTKNADNRNTSKLSKQENIIVSAGSMSDLKSYYESYIQTHPANETIISEMFYFIQKCKINLEDYESALNGYKAIMEKNPSNIAGLSAKWEYYDLKLLVASKTNGKGGGEAQLPINTEQLTAEQEHERLVNLIENFNENYTEDPKDGKPGNKKLTKEDRKVITQNIVKTLESNGAKDKTRLNILKEKVLSYQADASETAEYKKRTLLSGLIRTENINNIDEQIAMIQNDLRQILALDKSEGSAEVQSKVTPVVAFDYKLDQNYPNPFNPSTKINYEIKTAGFVSLKLYDLLGREIAELVNEAKDAGRYTFDFNAGKYMMASGIYFYRIKSGDFVDTKRMVLVK